jgi:hypothetical protein
MTSCSTDQSQQQATNPEPYANNTAIAEPLPEETDYAWAKENFDLQRVGPLLERSRDAAEFERYLNEPDGINNLDLNGDGYVDYISVDEFADRGPYERGLSLFTRFGPDIVQELGTVLFYRDEPRYPGARVLLTGSPQIYGDNVYYETNWLDRTLQIASFLFGDHDPYRSPYYYGAYPPNYTVYEVVDTPVYVTRVERLYPQPVFVLTSAPAIVEKIKIKSPNNGKWMEKVHAKLAKPTKEQIEWVKNNPNKGPKPKAEQGRSDIDRGRPDGEKGKPDHAAKPESPGQHRKAEGQKPDNGPPGKSDKSHAGGPPGQADKGGGGNKGGGKGKKP